MLAHSTPVLSLHVGRIQPLGPEGKPSAIDKQSVNRLLRVTALGLEGDAQADLKHHGGPDKALHHYPREHYAFWQALFPQHADVFQPGGFGENISTMSLSEETVCLGDVFLLGSAVVQVSQGRTPCWKLNVRFGIDEMVRRVQETGRTGWYYRILHGGEVAAGEPLTLLERPLPQWPLSRLWQVLHGSGQDPEALNELAQQKVLGAHWRERAMGRMLA